MTCEDFPCCGHEAGDCDGSKYGSRMSLGGLLAAAVWTLAFLTVAFGWHV